MLPPKLYPPVKSVYAYDVDLPKPREPLRGNIYIIFRRDEILGWRDSHTAIQALRDVFETPDTRVFDHGMSPKHRAVEWKFCKCSEQETALEEGEIVGQIVEGCDCQNSAELRKEVERLVSENESLRTKLNAFEKQRKANAK